MFRNKKEGLAKNLATALTENAIPAYVAKKDEEVVVELSRRSLYFRVNDQGEYLPVDNGELGDPIQEAGDVYDYVRGW